MPIDPPEGGKSVQGPSFSRDADGPRSCHSSSTRFLAGRVCFVEARLFVVHP